MTESEHVFYIAGAAIVSAYKIGEYKIWLMDRTNETKKDLWAGGGQPVESECVMFNCHYTFESPGPNGEIHTIDDYQLEKIEPKWQRRINRDIWEYCESPATAAISTDLWNSLPEADRPRPHEAVGRQEYRLQLVARRSTEGVLSYYLGFHVKVIGLGGAHPVVQFFSWTGDKLGADEVDLHSQAFEPQGPYTTISPTPQIDDEGALFVSLDHFAELPFLTGPKVPYGAHQGGSLLRRAHVRSDNSRQAERLAPGDVAALAVKTAPIVVASGGKDAWLDEARDVVVGEGTATDQGGVISEITRLLEEFPDRDAIELLSHSNDDNLLSFGGWVLDTNAFRSVSADLKDRLQGKVIRLVGCSTARDAKANAALRMLETRLGVTAYGTRGIVGTEDLSAEGSSAAMRNRFVRPHALGVDAVYRVTSEELVHGGEPKPFTSADRDALLAGLASESRHTVEQILRLLPPVYRTFKGILRKPSATIPLAPGDSKSPPDRIDALFRGQLIRFTRATWRQPTRREWLFWVQHESVQAELQTIFRWQA